MGLYVALQEMRVGKVNLGIFQFQCILLYLMLR